MVTVVGERVLREYDLVVVGAGPSGATVAECAARRFGWRTLVVERREHVGGLSHDTSYGSTGIVIHPYGPHYLRFTDADLFAYASRFTAWRPGNYVVKASVDGRLVPIPINLETLEILFDRIGLTAAAAEALLEGEREPIEFPANSEEYVLSRVGRKLYESLYLGYTQKQWDRHPTRLDPSVCGRIPVRLTRDDRYVDAPIQVMPHDGFTAMFSRMLDRPEIDVQLKTDWLEDRPLGGRATVFTGQLDEYFSYALGPLPWRSLRFDYTVENRPWVQPCVQINYPGVEPFTRSVEIKHVTGQNHPRTVIAREYSTSTGDPYYPIPALESRALHAQYWTLAEREKQRAGIHFTGRLAEYRYMNIDEAMAGARAKVAEIGPQQ